MSIASFLAPHPRVKCQPPGAGLNCTIMPCRQATKRIELTVPIESLSHYHSNVTKEIDSLAFEDVSVTQRHGFSDGTARFEITPTATAAETGSVITAYQEYRITAVVQDLSYQASLKARRMGRRAPKIRMKVIAAEVPAKIQSAWSATTVSDAGFVDATEAVPEEKVAFGIAM